MINNVLNGVALHAVFILKPELCTLRQRSMSIPIDGHSFLQYIREQPLGLYDPSSDIVIPYHEQKAHILTPLKAALPCLSLFQMLFTHSRFLGKQFRRYAQLSPNLRQFFCHPADKIISIQGV